MLVVVIDESTKASRTRVRRAVSKYLPQVGSGTWVGSLSQEGVEQLRDDVRKSAKRNTAVICFRVRSLRRYDVAWTAGDVSSWDDRGCYAFKLEKYPIPPCVPETHLKS